MRKSFIVALLAISAVASLPTNAPLEAAGDNTPWTVPTRPERCTSQQLAAGTVSGCLVTGRSAAAGSTDWPDPPFPTGPDGDVAVIPTAGWKWSGSSYNGSAALTDWESQFISNSTAVGPARVGSLRALPQALPLFEGFLREIVAGGYNVRDISMYSFRCTSTWNCAGLTKRALSLHTWGLAIDMNAGANPGATYTGINGASACATPMKTDIPRWVVETGEKWGLYWGGYGWNSGCTSPDEMKEEAVRDTHHFEFRGTPAQAEAIMVANMGGSCFDVANDAGVIGPRCLPPGGVPGARWRAVIDTNAPDGASAALVNIVITGAAAPGFVTAETCGPWDGARTSSNGNAFPGQTVANLAVVPLDSAGRFCLFRMEAMHTIVDVQGFFSTAGAAGADGTVFHPVDPERVMDTRIGSVCQPDGQCAEPGPIPALAETEVATPMVPAEAAAVLANLVVTEPAAPGYLTADQCSALHRDQQNHSNTNFAGGATVANLSVVPVEAARTGVGSRFCTISIVETHQVVDVQGYFAPASSSDAGLGFTALTARRLVDTRECWSDPMTAAQKCATRVQPGEVIRMNAPSDAAAVLVNMTLVDASAPGFSRAESCATISGPPVHSNGNIAVGGVTANLAVVGVDPDGTFCVTVSAPMHVVVDLQGIFSADGPLRFVPTSPERRSDTRVG